MPFTFIIKFIFLPYSIISYYQLLERNINNKNINFYSCEVAAGKAIDKQDGIDTSGFHIELGTAQVGNIIQSLQSNSETIRNMRQKFRHVFSKSSIRY